MVLNLWRCFVNSFSHFQDIQFPSLNRKISENEIWKVHPHIFNFCTCFSNIVTFDYPSFSIDFVADTTVIFSERRRDVNIPVEKSKLPNKYEPATDELTTYPHQTVTVYPSGKVVTHNKNPNSAEFSDDEDNVQQDEEGYKIEGDGEKDGEAPKDTMKEKSGKLKVVKNTQQDEEKDESEDEENVLAKAEEMYLNYYVEEQDDKQSTVRENKLKRKGKKEKKKLVTSDSGWLSEDIEELKEVSKTKLKKRKNIEVGKSGGLKKARNNSFSDTSVENAVENKNKAKPTQKRTNKGSFTKKHKVTIKSKNKLPFKSHK